MAWKGSSDKCTLFRVTVADCVGKVSGRMLLASCHNLKEVHSDSPVQ